MAGISKSLEQKLIAGDATNYDTFELAVEQFANTGGKLIELMVSENFVGASKVASVISTDYAVPVYDVSAHNLELSPVDVVDQKLVKKHKVLPLYKRGDRLLTYSHPSH